LILKQPKIQTSIFAVLSLLFVKLSEKKVFVPDGLQNSRIGFEEHNRYNLRVNELKLKLYKTPAYV
jgi:hypothetical protein